MAVDVETLRRIYATGENAFLEVGLWPEAPENIELRTTDKGSEEWFGKTSIIMTPDYAIALGQALITTATEINQGTKNAKR